MTNNSHSTKKKRKSITLKFKIDDWKKLEELAKEKGFNSPYGLINALVYSLLGDKEALLNERIEELQPEITEKLTILGDEIKSIKLKIGVISKRLSEIQDAIIEIRSYLISNKTRKTNDKIGD